MTFAASLQSKLISLHIMAYATQKWIHLVRKIVIQIPLQIENAWKNIPLSKFSCKSASQFVISQKVELCETEWRMYKGQSVRASDQYIFIIFPLKWPQI